MVQNFEVMLKKLSRPRLFLEEITIKEIFYKLVNFAIVNLTLKPFSNKLLNWFHTQKIRWMKSFHHIIAS